MSRRREVALVIDPGRPYDRRIVRGVAAYVQQQAPDWSLYVEEDPIARLPDLDAWAGDGILANFDNQRVARAVSDKGIPVVGVGGGYGYYKMNASIPYVRTDNRAIANLAAAQSRTRSTRSAARSCGQARKGLRPPSWSARKSNSRQAVPAL